MWVVLLLSWVGVAAARAGVVASAGRWWFQFHAVVVKGRQLCILKRFGQALFQQIFSFLPTQSWCASIDVVDVQFCF